MSELVERCTRIDKRLERTWKVVELKGTGSVIVRNDVGRRQHREVDVGERGFDLVGSTLGHVGRRHPIQSSGDASCEDASLPDVAVQ